MSLWAIATRARRVLVDRLLYPLGFRGRSARGAFSRIYARNAWLSRESFSGVGSDLVYTDAIRNALPDLLAELEVRTLLDAPCGDFNWMRHVDLRNVRYIGVDVVEALIEKNRASFDTKRYRFEVLDITSDAVPSVDLILCRDCLVHLPLKQCLSALHNFKRSGSRYLLTTTFPQTKDNADILMGHWRPLNLTLPPFKFPPPLRLLSEHYTGSDLQYIDKSLGLWRLDDVRI